METKGGSESLFSGSCSPVFPGPGKEGRSDEGRDGNKKLEGAGEMA